VTVRLARWFNGHGSLSESNPGGPANLSSSSEAHSGMSRSRDWLPEVQVVARESDSLMFFVPRYRREHDSSPSHLRQPAHRRSRSRCIPMIIIMMMMMLGGSESERFRVTELERHSLSISTSPQRAAALPQACRARRIRLGGCGPYNRHQA
jgi:hypothetical protein